MLTNQEAFDRVVKGIWQQGKQSYHDGRCFYQSKDGSKCAFGIILPDELYDPEMEFKEVEKIFSLYPKVQEYFSGVDPKLLMELQGKHDEMPPYLNTEFFRNTWLKCCNYIAKDFGLEMPQCVT